MVLYETTLAPLGEDLHAASLDLSAPFYVKNAMFNGLSDRISRLRTLLLEQGLVKGYLPELTKLLFMCESTDQEEIMKQEF